MFFLPERSEGRTQQHRALAGALSYSLFKGLNLFRNNLRN
nr:hypothetical protein [Serratia marcescens]